jgi:hypothetical protein
MMHIVRISRSILLSVLALVTAGSGVAQTTGPAGSYVTVMAGPTTVTQTTFGGLTVATISWTETPPTPIPPVSPVPPPPTPTPGPSPLSGVTQIGVYSVS